MAQDYYKILGVSKDASPDQLKKAYRKLAKKFHPDTSEEPNAEDRFKEIAEAYSVLSDPDKRTQYDNPLPKGFPQGGGLEDIFSQFDVGVEDFFPGFGRRRKAPPRPGNLRYRLNLDFMSAAKGKTIDVKVDRVMPCENCGSSGKTPETIEEVCGSCKGSGQTTFSQGFFQMSQDCQVCNGQGKKVKNPCSPCKGRGFKDDHGTVTVNIPPGVENGNVIRVPGWGHQNVRGVPPGDLFLEVRVTAHDQFRRKGNDIHTDVKITIPEAVLGCRREVKTIHDTTERILIPDCTQPGDTIRIKGKGAAGGDHVVNIRISFPRDLPKDLEDAYESVYAVTHPEG